MWRCSAAIDDRNEALLGIVPSVLRSRKAVTTDELEAIKKSVSRDKFEGHQHSTKLEIEGLGYSATGNTCLFQQAV